MKPGCTNRYSFKFKDGDKVLLKPTPDQAAQGAQIQTLKIVTSGWTIRSNEYSFVYVCKNEEEALMTVPAINVDMQGELANPDMDKPIVHILKENASSNIPWNGTQPSVDGGTDEGA